MIHRFLIHSHNVTTITNAATTTTTITTTTTTTIIITTNDSTTSHFTITTIITNNANKETTWKASKWLIKQNIPLPPEDQMLYDAQQKVSSLLL